jgi:membrane protease YdiL (CAAX protease family)
MFTDHTGRLRPLWSFLLSLAFSAVAMYACGYLAGAIAGDHIIRLELIFRALFALSLLGLYTWLLTVADQVEDHRLFKLGFPLAGGWRRQLASGCLLGLGMTLLAIMPIAIWTNVTVNILRLSQRTLARTAAVVLVLIFGALAEELMFRGYPFQRLTEAIGPAAAIAVFSVLFGAVHLMNPGATLIGLINTVLIGLVLALAYLRTGALWLPWGLHFGWNASLGLLFGLPVSGLRIFNAVDRTSATGAPWLTGGSYGPEASLPAMFAVVVGLVVVWRWPVKRLNQDLTPERQLPEPLDQSTGIQP